MESLKSIFFLIAPAIVRALTFFLDTLWGNAISRGAVKFMPAQISITQTIIFAVLASVIIGLFKKWAEGDLHVFDQLARGRPGLTDPNEGVVYH